MRGQSAGKQSIINKLGRSSFRAQEYERPGVSSDEIQEIKDAFDLFDPERTGFVSTAELLASLDSLGIETRQQPLYHMIADKLDEGFTSLEFEDFLDLMINRVSKKDTRQDIRKIFNLFDEEKTGFITIKTLKKVIKDLGENIDESQLQEMIQKADSDKDGMVSEQQFYNIMVSPTPNARTF